jgi:uncharacterized membrane protein
MRVTLFTKPDCHLCDQVKEELKQLQPIIPHDLVEVDIEQDDDLEAQYAESIPVVAVGPYTLKAPISAVDLKVALLAAHDSEKQSQKPSRTAKQKRRLLSLNKSMLFISRHWLAIANFVVLLFVGLPFAAPALMKAGIETPARLIYGIYSPPLCHQLAYRSWFLFGDQVAYPLDGVYSDPDSLSFEDVTGLSRDDLQEASQFIGNDQIGYKVAFCERDVGIYAGILLGGLIFALSGKRIKSIPLWLWFIVGVLPMAIDGGSQLLGAVAPFNLPDFLYRESSPLLRSLTGGLFGLMNVWLAYPLMEETFAETRIALSSKLATRAVEEAQS